MIIAAKKGWRRTGGATGTALRGDPLDDAAAGIGVGFGGARILGRRRSRGVRGRIDMWRNGRGLGVVEVRDSWLDFTPLRGLGCALIKRLRYPSMRAYIDAASDGRVDDDSGEGEENNERGGKH